MEQSSNSAPFTMEDHKYQKLQIGGDDQSLNSDHTVGKQPNHSGTVAFKPSMGSSRLVILAALVAAALGVTIGVLIGWFSSQAQFPNEEAYMIWQKALEGEDAAVREMILEGLKAENIKENLRKLTEKPHLAGTKEDLENANYVKNLWDAQGLDSAKIVPYNVLLSYPVKETPNYVYILNQDGSVFYRSDAEEKELDEGDKHPDTVFPFNAYAANGIEEGDLVYVNYGRIEDFQQLQDELKVNVSGKICIARYGKIFRGDKAKHAQQYGAVGLVLYSDPADYAAGDTQAVYPDTWWLPGTGVQRGSLYINQGLGGDPLTPAYPSSEYAYRYDEDDINLPRIPVQPIGYENAKHFLEQLDGPDAPGDWQGNIEGLTKYKLGPGFVDGRRAKIEVNNIRERRWTYNAIGMIKGSQEPDRYVILGNHRDAWVFGAIDPSSGTAAMLEVTRVMGNLVKNGKWRPRRSIIFCSWAAEEYSLIGSTEWIEEFAKNLGSRTVAYLNVDISIQGNYTFRAKTTPNLNRAVFAAAQNVPDAPFPGHSKTVYDTWLDRNPDGNVPKVSNLGSGSDYASFLGQLGISAVDLRYTYDSDLGISSYPLYHSMYETFHLVAEIMDPSFEYHLAVARVWAEMARNLADSLILPFNCTDYVDNLQKSVQSLKESYEEDMNQHGITFDDIDSALSNLTNQAKMFHDRIAKAPQNDPFYVRRINDQLMYVDRAFTDPLGLPDRQLQRHVAFAPSSRDAYFGEAFPGIADLMFDIDKSPDPEAAWDKVKQHMSVIAFTLQSVTTTIMDVEGISTLAPDR